MANETRRAEELAALRRRLAEREDPETAEARAAALAAAEREAAALGAEAEELLAGWREGERSDRGAAAVRRVLAAAGRAAAETLGAEGPMTLPLAEAALREIEDRAAERVSS